MDVVGSFIGVNRLEITHVAENGVFQSDSICSHQIACQAGRFQSDPHIIPLCHGGLAEVQLAFIFQAAESPCEQLSFRDFCQHMRELFLDQLELSDWLVELNSSFRVFDRPLVASHRGTNGAPSDSIPAGSDPWSGSVRPKQPIFWPRASNGSHFCFCSSVPKVKIGYITSAP